MQLQNEYYFFHITSARVLAHGTGPFSDVQLTTFRKLKQTQLHELLSCVMTYFACLKWVEHHQRRLHSIYSEIKHRFFSVFSPACFARGLFPGPEQCIEGFLKAVSKYSFSRTPKLLLLAGLPGPASVVWLNECNALKTSLHNRKPLSLFPAQQATLP